MPEFGESSKKNLSQAHPDLQKIFNRVIEIMDCSVICGFRGEAAQMEAYNSGRSKLSWPNSRHNTVPSMAVDVAPYPIDWSDAHRAYFLAGVVKAVAHEMGIKIRWGGDWDNDGDLNDQSFFDLPHYELV